MALPSSSGRRGPRSGARPTSSPSSLNEDRTRLDRDLEELRRKEQELKALEEKMKRRVAELPKELEEKQRKQRLAQRRMNGHPRGGLTGLLGADLIADIVAGEQDAPIRFEANRQVQANGGQRRRVIKIDSGTGRRQCGHAIERATV